MWYLPVLERNLLPDWLIRVGIRRLLADRICTERRYDIGARHRRFAELIAALRDGPIAVHSDAANEQHYQLPHQFFEMVLGKSLKYSCAYWRAGIQSLDAAEKQMLQLTCERAQVADGQRILDLGCGWGSLSLYMAETCPNARITGVSNSAQQRLYIEREIHERGLKNLTILTADMNTFDIGDRFDCVISVEMFEHMRNYAALLSRIASWLNPGGRLFIHIFCHDKFAYTFETDGENDWMARNFFTGGLMPSANLLLYFQEDVNLLQQWLVNGRHYQQTSEAWLKNMDAKKTEITRLFRQTYGDREGLRHWVNWRVFFMACAELFGYRAGNEWLVSHYLFTRR